MALPVYPGALPYRPIKGPYQRVRQNTPARETDMESGEPRKRRVGTVQIRRDAIVLRFTGAELLVWAAFYRTDLNYGSGWFQMPVWDEETGNYVTRDVIIRGDATTAPRGAFYAVSMTLDIKVPA